MQSDILDKIVSILITKHSNIVREEQIFYEREKNREASGQDILVPSSSDKGAFLERDFGLGKPWQAILSHGRTYREFPWSEWTMYPLGWLFAIAHRPFSSWEVAYSVAV